MSQLKIASVSSFSKQRRVASHTHITGLGLNPDGTAKDVAQGLVGQKEAREVN